MPHTITYRKFGEYTIREIHVPGKEPHFALEDIAKVLGLSLEEAKSICQEAVELQNIDGVDSDVGLNQ